MSWNHHMRTVHGATRRHGACVGEDVGGQRGWRNRRHDAWLCRAYKGGRFEVG